MDAGSEGGRVRADALPPVPLVESYPPSSLYQVCRKLSFRPKAINTGTVRFHMCYRRLSGITPGSVDRS